MTFVSVKYARRAGACRVKEDVYEGLAVWAEGYNKPHCLTWAACLTSRFAFELRSGLFLPCSPDQMLSFWFKSIKTTAFKLIFLLYADDAMLFLWKKRKSLFWFMSLWQVKLKSWTGDGWWSACGEAPPQIMALAISEKQTIKLQLMREEPWKRAVRRWERRRGCACCKRRRRDLQVLNQWAQSSANVIPRRLNSLCQSRTAPFSLRASPCIIMHWQRVSIDLIQRHSGHSFGCCPSGFLNSFDSILTNGLFAKRLAVVSTNFLRLTFFTRGVGGGGGLSIWWESLTLK